MNKKSDSWYLKKNSVNWKKRAIQSTMFNLIYDNYMTEPLNCLQLIVMKWYEKCIIKVYDKYMSIDTECKHDYYVRKRIHNH